MQERNDAWVRDRGLQGRHYHWSLDDAELVFPSESEEVVADICWSDPYPCLRAPSFGRGRTPRSPLMRAETWREFESSARETRLSS